MKNLTGLRAGIVAGIVSFFMPTATGLADNHNHDNTIIFVSGPSSEPFFGAIEKGFTLAVEQLGANGEYVAPAGWNDIVQTYTRFVEVAIAREPAAIVIGNFFPESLTPLIQEAREKDIAVVLYNSGRDNWQELGATAFIGEEPFQMGYVAGKAAHKNGVSNGICINQIAANPVLQLRCDGYVAALEEAGGQGDTLILQSEDSNNSQRVRATVRGILLSNPDIDGILTLAAHLGVDAVEAVADADKADVVRVGTIDLSNLALELIREGRMDFAIDQQPFLQGYYGVLLAQQHLDFGLAPTNAMNSGPLLIDSSNVNDVLAVGSRFPGVRGAN
ncbi:MAG: substrate-binding domain-containing protein [Roseitalea sp.]|jgi:simple sugar transport system substrate-binding protein|nr:substrate-binding domain-containing protein [Roseitalea sp.]MBO6721114.1 substrate-binding domain-containing protein [Roseitalea sp.]MBO6744172.1 substrate-binding domain-containing protein [Roseitalea sp.]